MKIKSSLVLSSVVSVILFSIPQFSQAVLPVTHAYYHCTSENLSRGHGSFRHYEKVFLVLSRSNEAYANFIADETIFGRGQVIEERIPIAELMERGVVSYNYTRLENPSGSDFLFNKGQPTFVFGAPPKATIILKGYRNEEKWPGGQMSLQSALTSGSHLGVNTSGAKVRFNCVQITTLPNDLKLMSQESWAHDRLLIKNSVKLPE